MAYFNKENIIIQQFINNNNNNNNNNNPKEMGHTVVSISKLNGTSRATALLVGRLFLISV